MEADGNVPENEANEVAATPEPDINEPQAPEEQGYMNTRKCTDQPSLDKLTGQCRRL